MPTPLETKFTAALKDSFNDTSSGLAAAITGGLWDVATNRSPLYPLCQITAVESVEPGESLEDRRIDVTFTLKANDQDAVESCATALMAWFDPNPNRAPLAWTTGNEVFNWRGDAQLERPSQRVKDGARLWTYTIPYVFHVYDEVP